MAAITPVMPQIKTIVHLMLENRSLDYLLGWLYDKEAPKVVYPPGSGGFDGLSNPPGGVPYANNYRGTNEPTTFGTNPSPSSQELRMPLFDPDEGFDSTLTQMYYNNGNNHQPSDPWGTTPPMSGFAFSYAEFYDSAQDAMGGYTPDQLPIMNGLAKNFAVSDRWFASLPSETNANRAFSICGTSLGGVDNGTPKTYQAPTLFNALGTNKTWGLFWQFDSTSVLAPLVSGDPGGNTPCYTGNLFPELQTAIGPGKGSIETMDTFYALAKAGQLPNFCYVEPYWGGGKGIVGGDAFIGIQGNDFHPCAWLGPAESSLNDLYNALITSPQWESMLFVVTFDECGGTYDHVPAPATIAPDGNTSVFDFERLGVRVPTILVSPYIQPGTVFRAPAGSQYDFDHTSMIATILKWAGVDPTTAGLGARVAVAPTFEDVLLTVPSGITPPTFAVPDGYADQGGGVGTTNPKLDMVAVKPAPEAEAAVPKPGAMAPPSPAPAVTAPVDIESLATGVDTEDLRTAWGQSQRAEDFVRQVNKLKRATLVAPALGAP